MYFIVIISGQYVRQQVVILMIWPVSYVHIFYIYYRYIPTYPVIVVFYIIKYF